MNEDTSPVDISSESYVSITFYDADREEEILELTGSNMPIPQEGDEIHLTSVGVEFKPGEDPEEVENSAPEVDALGAHTVESVMYEYTSISYTGEGEGPSNVPIVFVDILASESQPDNQE